MPYPKIIYLITRMEFNPWLREDLRCEYRKNPHPLRPDFPPDLVLRDQEPPDIIFKDEITEEFWGVEFGVEIVVTPFPYAVWWRTGIRLNNGWNLRMRNGELILSTIPLQEPMGFNFIEQAGFQLQVVDEELVYTEKVANLQQEWFNIAWALYFRGEITVTPWQYVTPMNGIVLNDNWVMEMKKGEIVLEQGVSLLVPFIHSKPDRWRFQLELVAGELKYSPFFEAEP